MKFYGQFDPPVDKFIYETFFKDYPLNNKGFFIECGAFDGQTESSCKFFEETLGWKGINVEPSPVIYQELIKNRPNAINVNVALSNVSEKQKFTAVIHPAYGELCTNGSLHHSTEHKKLLDSMGCQYKEYEINVITFKQLVKQYKVKKIDLFVLDVEGNELKVIEAMRGSRVLPKIMCVEHGNLDQTELINQMGKLGYRFNCQSFVNSFFVRKSFWERVIGLFRRII